MKIYQIIKDKINSGSPINVEKLINIVKKYDVISFDIFDTLLKRNVKKPTDIFEYIEKNNKISNFAKNRILAEKAARDKCNKNEITLNDIYVEYGEDYSKNELDAESENLTVNEDILPLYNYCIENKKVVLTSDMYLPEEYIQQILKREGIVGFEKLYLSSSLNKTKKNGELFEFVIEDLQIDKSKIIHIGDSIISDYRVPKKMKISAIHIPTFVRKAKYQINGDDINENIINSFINNTIPNKCDDYYRFGYEKFGMFLWGYVKWIHEKIIDEGIKKVYFFSRDGLIMKKAFDTLYNDVQSVYLEVSRRALRVPILWMNYKLEHVVDMITPSKLISLSSIFDSVGLDIENYIDLIKKYNFNIDTYFDRNEIKKNINLQKLYEELEKDIEKVSRKEYEYLVKYINQNKIEGKFAIVDIGWSGGMQRYLCEALDALKIEYQVKGLYCGVADYYKRNKAVIPSLDLNGYLFDCSHDNNSIDRRSSFVGLFETLFLEQAGTVINYKEENKVIKGNRARYEYIENGNPTKELEYVRKIQQGALDFVKKFGNKNIVLSSIKLFEGIEETGTNPTKKDLDLFADFRFFDDGETQCLAKPRKLIKYIINIDEFKKDFLKSRWKIGFMKRMFRIKLPYKKIYYFLKNRNK